MQRILAGASKDASVACQGDIVPPLGLAQQTNLPSAHSMVEQARTKSTNGAEFSEERAIGQQSCSPAVNRFAQNPLEGLVVAVLLEDGHPRVGPR